METVKRSVVSGFEGGRDEQVEHRGIPGRLALYEMMMVDTHHCPLIQTHSKSNARVTPSVDHGLWATMTCQYGFVHCINNKGTMCLEEVQIGRNCVGERWYMEALYTFCSAFL